MTVTGRKRALQSLPCLLEWLESRVLLSAADFASADPADQLFAQTVLAMASGKKKSGAMPHASSPIAGSLTPTQIRAAYGINQIMFGSVFGDGSGQTIAIIDAYDDPNAFADLQIFDAQYGLPDPPSFTRVAQDGSNNYPTTDPNGPSTSHSTWEWEESLDIQWAHVIAPEANIILVEANSSSYSNLITGAVGWARSQPGINIITMSFGGTEFASETTLDSNFTTPSGHDGITFVASTGDNGSPGGYPAYSPNVVAVGGTTLNMNGNNYGSETGWNNSGGGISVYEPKPSYQQTVVQSATQRTIPDVSMDGNPNTGVSVYDSFDFGTGTGWFQVGGTSLAAPMFAGLIAVANQGRVISGLGTLDGPSQTLPKLYAIPSTDFHDVTSGSNGLYSATTGYDLVTGRGSPIANLMNLDLAEAGSISGRVYQDNNGDGIFDAGDTPLSGATVYIDSNNNGVYDVGGSKSAGSGNINQAIPDNSTTGITSSVNLTGLAGSISDVNVNVNITHSRDNQLTLTLIAPDGTQIVLASKVGGSNANFTNTTFDDQAGSSIASGSAPFNGSYRTSSGLLSTLNGDAANGTWKLKVTDTVSNRTGTLNSWSITVTTATEMSTTSASDGTYQFKVFTGNYMVREIVPAGFVASAAASHAISVTAGSTGNDFADFATIYAAATPNSNYYLWIDPNNSQLDIGTGNAASNPSYTIALATLPSLSFNFNSAGGQLIFDFTNGSPLPAGGLTINGGGFSDNMLAIIGQSPAQQFSMSDSQLTPISSSSPIAYSGFSNLSVNGATVFFTGSLNNIMNVNLLNGAAFFWTS